MAEIELQQIGPYPVAELLRRSSTCDFYRGKQRKKDILLQRLRIALPTPEGKERFLARAKQLRKLKSRDIINVLDANFDGDYGYLVMEYTAGKTLQQHIVSGQKLATDHVKRYLSPIAYALHYAHLNNIQHGNLHPGALLTTEQAPALLTDFALTPTIVAIPEQPLLHDEGFAIPYMAPEHLDGHPCPASDQYALAVMVYEWLCGRRPYDATERELLREQQEQVPIPPPSSLNKAISPAVERVLLQALAFDPASRFPHEQEFAQQYLGALMGFAPKPAPVMPRSAIPIAPATLLTTNGATTSANGNSKQSAAEIVKRIAAQLDRRKADEVTPEETVQNDLAPVPDAPSKPLASVPTPTPEETHEAISAPETAVADTPMHSKTLLSERALRPHLNASKYETKAENSPVRKREVTSEPEEIFAEDDDLPIDFAFGASRLGSVVTADLCQGGMLSQRLPRYEERPAQVEMARVVTRAITEHVPAIIEASTGTGKALDVDTPIPTPSGWKRMGELVVGDCLFDEQGRPTRITAAFDIMHERPCYEVVFSDGSSLVADAEHEWASYSCTDRPYTLVTTEQMAATLTVDASGQTNHAIAVAGALALPNIDLPVDPYFLGIRLSDGNNEQRAVVSTAPHTEVASGRVRCLPPPAAHYPSIPTAYLRASEQQRRALLAGLLDTDGTVNRSGAAEFTTTSPQLAQDTHELICSLGFRPSLRQSRARLNGKDCGPSKWTIAFTTDQQVFRLERKVATHKERLLNYTSERNRFRYVVEVRAVPSRPVRCIQVEALSHLYLAGRTMIPTHNSLAYLVPVVRSGQVAIISTANKALQEQLFYKDIPFVQKHIKRFDAALVKGVNNYVCIDRVEGQRMGMQHYVKNRDFQRLYELMLDPDAKFNGDFETLGFQLPGDIRGQVATDSDLCAWNKCSYFGDCYVREMRERAERAQIIVVNHTLLLLDAAIGGFLLPDRDLIVLDEAHHLEEEATRSFTITVNATRILSLLAQNMLKKHSQLSLQDDVMRATQETWARLEEVANPGYKGRMNLEAPLEEGLRLANLLIDLTDSLRKQRPKDLEEKDGQLYDKLLKRAQNLAEDIRTVFSVATPTRFVYYVERAESAGSRGVTLHVSAAPLDVTSWLKEKLFDKCNVVCTSATLATVSPNPTRPEEKGANFSYFRRRIGLDPQQRSDVLESILPLTFDYESNALLYLPRDLPAPTFGTGSDEYMKSIAREMYKLVKLSRGRAFLLFSSKRMLDRAYELMAPHLPYPLLKQGDMTRMELTRRFRKEEGSVLFGLKSFWEGVDIAGEALSLVVIDKLPFDPPDDPVHEARVAQMKAAGENWFGTYVLPQAVLRLKQGLGRLLRSREDRGVMAILDTRLYTKGYGKMVLNALPPARHTASLRDVERFFAVDENRQ